MCLVRFKAASFHPNKIACHEWMKEKAAVQHFTIDGCVFLSLTLNTPINGFRFNLLWITWINEKGSLGRLAPSAIWTNFWRHSGPCDVRIYAHILEQECLDCVDQKMHGSQQLAYSFLMLRFTDQGAAPLFVDWRQPKLHCARRTIQQCLPSKLHSGRRMAWLCKQRRSPLRASASGPDGSPLLSALQPLFDKAESKRSISSYTGGGSQSQVLLPTDENNSRRQTAFTWLNSNGLSCRLKCLVQAFLWIIVRGDSWFWWS